jgi:hypothetical protein
MAAFYLQHHAQRQAIDSLVAAAQAGPAAPPPRR